MTFEGLMLRNDFYCLHLDENDILLVENIKLFNKESNRILQYLVAQPIILGV